METTYTICIGIAILIGLYQGLNKSIYSKKKSYAKIDQELIDYFLKGK